MHQIDAKTLIVFLVVMLLMTFKAVYPILNLYNVEKGYTVPNKIP